MEKLNKTIILPILGLLLITLAEGIRGVVGERGIEFNASHDQVAEAAVQSERLDLLPMLRRFEDGVFVQYTPQGRRIDTEVTAENIKDIFDVLDENLVVGIKSDGKVFALAIEAGLVPNFGGDFTEDEETFRTRIARESEVVDNEIKNHPIQLSDADLEKAGIISNDVDAPKNGGVNENEANAENEIDESGNAKSEISSEATSSVSDPDAVGNQTAEVVKTTPKTRKTTPKEAGK